MGLVAVVRELLGTVDVEVAGICVDGHGPTLCAVDRAGRPTRAAITWLDRRAEGEAAELASATGLLGWALGVLPSALWLERHEPEVAGRTAWYLNSWEALAMRLTGLARTTLAASQAWPTVPISSRRSGSRRAGWRRWSRRARSLGVWRAAAESLGLPAGTPVIAGMVDAFASFHGAAMLEPGDAVDVGGSAGGFGVYWDAPVTARVPSPPLPPGRSLRRRRRDGRHRTRARLVPQ